MSKKPAMRITANPYSVEHMFSLQDFNDECLGNIEKHSGCASYEIRKGVFAQDRASGVIIYDATTGIIRRYQYTLNVKA